MKSKWMKTLNTKTRKKCSRGEKPWGGNQRGEQKSRSGKAQHACFCLSCRKGKNRGELLCEHGGRPRKRGCLEELFHTQTSECLTLQPDTPGQEASNEGLSNTIWLMLTTSGRSLVPTFPGCPTNSFPQLISAPCQFSSPSPGKPCPPQVPPILPCPRQCHCGFVFALCHHRKRGLPSRGCKSGATRAEVNFPSLL